MFKFIIFALVISNENYSFGKRVDSICSNFVTKSNRIILRLNDSGILTARNITINNNNINNNQRCSVEIVSCPSCIISLKFMFLNLSCSCGDNNNLFICNPSSCDFVWIAEPEFETSGIFFSKKISNSDFVGKGSGYRSQTRGVKIFLFYSRPHAHAFTMEYKSEMNRQFFFGSLKSHKRVNSTKGFIASPFFPAFYPKDLISEYIISCVSQEKLSPCKIYLAFTDFQLGYSSIIQLYDGRYRVGSITGSSFRPPVILSTSNSLTVRFYANGHSNLGFKAAYTFLTGVVGCRYFSVCNSIPGSNQYPQDWNRCTPVFTKYVRFPYAQFCEPWLELMSQESGLDSWREYNYVKNWVKPSVDCGGFVENIGGTITMMNMANSELKMYDCIWLIKPLKNIFNTKSHLYLKITTFVDFAGQAELEIRQGLTSESPLLESIQYPAAQKFKEHIFPLEFGYYISIKALFGPASHLAIAYSSFSFNQCLVFSDFFCQNYRCISKKLRCDGFDHCGDNSDEPAICYKDWNLEPRVGRWYTNSPNFYFPKIKNYSDLHAASLALLASLVAFVFLASALSLILYQMSGRNQQRNCQSQFQLSLSDLQDGFSDEVYVENIVFDDPPLYEPPPNYQDVIQGNGKYFATASAAQV